MRERTGVFLTYPVSGYVQFAPESIVPLGSGSERSRDPSVDAGCVCGAVAPTRSTIERLLVICENKKKRCRHQDGLASFSEIFRVRIFPWESRARLFMAERGNKNVFPPPTEKY